ncbi:MAG: hypothetical protein WB443_02745 [Nitrososphaeraceae archaeon]
MVDPTAVAVFMVFDYYGIFDSRMTVITGRRQFIAFVMDLPLSRELIRQIPLSATEYL